MKKILLTLAASAALLMAEGLTLTSDLGGQLSKAEEFDGFGCSGKNISPKLSWSGVPEGTKSLAVTMYDPDAPTGSGWWHWLVVNIPADATELAKGAGNAGGTLPKGALQALNNYGTNAFGGACPPEGDKAHRYVITVHALDVDKLDVNEKTMPPVVGFMINAHTIQKASIMSYYKR